jgi:hypothetical protein
MCHYAECRYAECRYAECRYAECHYAECRYAECRGARSSSRTFGNLLGTISVDTPVIFTNIRLG